MKPHKICPNCGGKEFYTHLVSANGAVNLLPGTFWGEYELRVCGDCGLTNWFVPEKYLLKVKKKFSREALKTAASAGG